MEKHPDKKGVDEEQGKTSCEMSASLKKEKLLFLFKLTEHIYCIFFSFFLSTIFLLHEI